MVRDESLGRGNYAGFAARYAVRVPTQPYNAFYERPATLSLLPDIADGRVLDAGCGAGHYIDELLRRGAAGVVGIDVTVEMLKEARRRLGSGAPLVCGDLAHPLPFRSESFDVVLSSLVLHYVADWEPVFAEFRRVLRPGGTLVFSTGHPAEDIALARERDDPDTDYFARTRLALPWKSWGDPVQTMTFLRRSLQDTLNPLAEAGLVLDRILEPVPTEEFRAVRPESYEKLRRAPSFLCVRARRGGR